MSGITVCEGCTEPVDLNDATLVRAGLQESAGGPTVADEPDVLFHAECFPTDSPVWVRR